MQWPGSMGERPFDLGGKGHWSSVGAHRQRRRREGREHWSRESSRVKAGGGEGRILLHSWCEHWESSGGTEAGKSWKFVSHLLESENSRE